MLIKPKYSHKNLHKKDSISACAQQYLVTELIRICPQSAVKVFKNVPINPLGSRGISLFTSDGPPNL